MTSPRFASGRRAPVLLVLLAVLAAACSTERADPPPASSPSPAATETGMSPSPHDRPLGPFEQIACNLRPKELRRIWAGYDPDRSGQIQILPERPNFIGKWLSHSGPWDYVQRVPLFLYGPGHIAPGVTIPRAITTADIAPTFARLLDFEFDALDGRPIEEAILPADRPPRLILTVIWDAAGINVLEEYPEAWPTLRALVPEGTWSENASVGSSPSVTPSIHATLGTGAFPRNHGLVDLRFKVGGELLPSREVGPRQLLTPTLADVYDAAMSNEPLVGLVASGGTLGMLGQGTLFEGGDKDLVVAEFRGMYRAQVNTDLFSFPDYVTRVPGPEGEVRIVDLEDGRADGAWYGEPISLDLEDLAHTPAFSDYQERLLETVIEREGFGADDVPDLLFTNFKQIDNVSHRWSMNSPQMEAVVRSSDTALAALVGFLDREVGKGEWVLALTSDHGATPRPDTTGAFVIDNKELFSDLQAAFDGDGDDRPAIIDFRVTQVWVDVDELAENGHTIKDVARFVADYKKVQNVPDPSQVPESERDDLLFEAAFPGAVLEGLPCLEE